MKDTIRKEIDKAISEMMAEASVTAEIPVYTVEVPNNPDHGDFAANAALKLAGIFRKNPLEIAEILAARLKNPLIKSVEVVRPGFINFRISGNFYQDFLSSVLVDDEPFRSSIGGDMPMQVEFVSANPTGPLHVGHGRGAAYGDSLARVLDAAGYKVQREYYINDAGNQMNNLGKSIYSRYMTIAGGEYEFPEDGYKGDYIVDIAQELFDANGDSIKNMPQEEGIEFCFKKGLADITKSIEDDLCNFRVSFDRWFSEKSLYADGDVEMCINELRERGFVYDKDDAVWFKSTEFGDDKDRVIRKQTGEYTYFASDIAYHRNKFLRGFKKVVDVWGADHHGYVKRLVSSTKALGFNDVETEVVLIQMVNLVEEGSRISMSTRAGEFITLEWLISEVGADAARFFYMSRAHDAQFDFDLALAKKKSNDNPVFYVQYAYARVCSLFRKCDEENITYKIGEGLHRLDSNEEKELLKKMYDMRGIVELSAKHLEPHRVTYYLKDLASQFHSYYYNTQIINAEDMELTNARLSLAKGLASAIRFGLDLVGVSAPERM